MSHTQDLTCDLMRFTLPSLPSRLVVVLVRCAY
jgi:hypothetical protein